MVVTVFLHLKNYLALQSIIDWLIGYISNFYKRPRVHSASLDTLLGMELSEYLVKS